MTTDDSPGTLVEQMGLLEEWAAAKEIGVATKTLEGYRKRGIGPPYSLIKRKPLYAPTGLRAWIEEGGARER